MMMLALFDPVNTALTPSFCCSVDGWVTHEPGVVTPMSVRNWDAMPEPDSGRYGAIVAELVPPTSFHVVSVQE
jgi:hypothetical protein